MNDFRQTHAPSAGFFVLQDPSPALWRKACIHFFLRRSGIMIKDAVVLWCFGALGLQSAFSRQPLAATCDLRPADRKIQALVLWCRKRRGPPSITTGSLCAAGLEPLARKHQKRAVKKDCSFFTAPFYGGTFRFTFSGTSHSSRLDLPGRSGRAYRSSSHPLRTRLL